MRQVPKNSKTGYLVVGNGKLAHHFANYFTLLDVPFSHWHRNSSSSFLKEAGNTAKILVLIPDGEIQSFIQNNPLDESFIWIHCSGALSIPEAESAHPLMTFSDELYDLDTYKSIPFVTEVDRKSFSELFPELTNQSYKIDSVLKNYYHAWCSMAGNFTTILWTEFFKRLESEFGIDKSAAAPYLKKITANLQTMDNPLTGPLARGDKATIRNHLKTLENDDFVEVYNAFKCVFEKNRKEIELL